MNLQTLQDCGFSFWVDDESSPWVKEMLRCLKDKVFYVNKEHGKMEGDLAAKDMKLQAMEEQLKNKNQCIDVLVWMCMVQLFTIVYMMMA